LEGGVRGRGGLLEEGEGCCRIFGVGEDSYYWRRQHPLPLQVAFGVRGGNLEEEGEGVRGRGRGG